MSACSNGQPVSNSELDNDPVKTPVNLTDNPSAEEVKEAISVIDTITEIGIATEENDPNGQLGKQGGYTGCIYFVDSNAPDIEGTDAIEKGTDGGGCIEIYANSSDANKRNDYLATLDGGILASGSHCVLGTLVIRTSSKMTASKQKALEQAIIDVFEGRISNGQPESNSDSNNKPVKTPRSMTENPSAEEVKNAISVIDSVTAIGIVTEENDPNGHLGKQGGYTGCIYFVDSNAPDIEGTDAIEKGTNGGGCIEIYANSSDANKRNDYLAALDGGVLASGSHSVLGTLVIRTSNELTASKQKALEQAIIDVLEGKTPKSLVEPSPLTESVDFRTETYARLEFLIESSWEKKISDDGLCMYYPPVSEKTGYIQCSWIEGQIGDVSTDQARTLLDSRIVELQKNFDVEEISRTYYKIGDNSAMRVAFYYGLAENDINNDKRSIIDTVVVLYDDGMSVFMALFTETEYNLTYGQIIKTSLESIQLDKKATSTDTSSASSTLVENKEEGEKLDLNAINNTNSADFDKLFTGKTYCINGIVEEAIPPSDGFNALVIIHPDITAKGMGAGFSLEINIWLNAEDFKSIGGESSLGKEIEINAVLTSISRNATSKNTSVKGYPTQLEFGQP